MTVFQIADDLRFGYGAVVRNGAGGFDNFFEQSSNIYPSFSRTVQVGDASLSGSLNATPLTIGQVVEDLNLSIRTAASIPSSNTDIDSAFASLPGGRIALRVASPTTAIVSGTLGTTDNGAAHQSSAFLNFGGELGSFTVRSGATPGTESFSREFDIIPDPSVGVAGISFGFSASSNVGFGTTMGSANANLSIRFVPLNLGEEINGIDWLALGSGNFSDETNWDPAQVPGSSDTAIFGTQGRSVVNVGGQTVDRLIISGDPSTDVVFQNTIWLPPRRLWMTLACS